MTSRVLQETAAAIAAPAAPDEVGGNPQAGLGPLQTRVYEDLESLESLLHAWEDLLSAFPSATIFSTWEWLAPWWRSFSAEQGLRLKVVAFFDSRSRLIGLAPLSVGPVTVRGGLTFRVLRLMGDGSGDSDNLDVPARPGCEAVIAAALLDWIQANARLWDYCEFNTLPSGSPVGQALAKLLQDRRWTSYTYTRPWSVVPLPETWESFLPVLSSEDRNNLGRYQKRLEKRFQARFYRCTRSEEIPALLEELFRLHQLRWEAENEPGTFVSETRRRFYADMAAKLVPLGRLDFWFLDIDGKSVAAQFGMRYGDTVFQLQEGFDPAHNSDRVGFLLRGYVFRQLIAEGIRHYDFLAGATPHKARWGSRVGNYVNIHFARPYTRGGFFLRWVSNFGDSKAWIRAHVPQRAWDALHWINCKVFRIPVE